jgi:hypothetical protein
LRSARFNAAAFPRRKPATAWSGHCRGRADQARISGWEVKGFRRNHDLPRSEPSHVLHDTVLAIGEAGFTTIPSLQALPASKPPITGNDGAAAEIAF